MLNRYLVDFWQILEFQLCFDSSYIRRDVSYETVWLSFVIAPSIQGDICEWHIFSNSWELTTVKYVHLAPGAAFANIDLLRLEHG